MNDNGRSFFGMLPGLIIDDIPEEEVLNEARAVYVVNKFFHYLCITTDSLNEICQKLKMSKRALKSSVSSVFSCFSSNNNFQKLIDFSRNFHFSLDSSSPIYLLVFNGQLTLENCTESVLRIYI